MAPALTEEAASLPIRTPGKPSVVGESKMIREPLKQSGALDSFTFEDVTPVIGREFTDVNIVDDLLNGPDSDARLRDMAINISERCVVFFRAQDNLTNELQKEFVHKMGLLAGKPSTNTLHIHPQLNDTSEFGVGDAQISNISSVGRKQMYTHEKQADKRKYDSARWHTDIQFERAPADYTSLRLTQLPRTGGDTLWASGYELYDRFSRPYQKMFEGLTCNFIGSGFLSAAAREPTRYPIFEGPRGSPSNVGSELATVHPVVRTHPVTGWKSIFSVGSFAKSINELTARESDDLLNTFHQRILDNHDLTVRFKWRNKNDIAIWDNRCAFHCATFDYEGLGDRYGNRAVGIGEEPYFDPNSKSRSDDLGLHEYDDAHGEGLVKGYQPI